MQLKALIFSLFAFSFGSDVQAKEAITPAGLDYCTVCHGSQLKGNVNIGAPRLSGLSSWYVERQLRNFKLGRRGSHPADQTGGEMMLMVSNLSDEEISEVAQWVTQTVSVKPKPMIEGNIHLGKKQYQACAACHGERGEGNKAFGAPKLNSLNDWYLVTQLNHFRFGYRGADQADIYGQQMKAASSVILSEEDAANLATYIYQLK